MAEAEPTPEGRYDERVYLPQDDDDGTEGLAFSEIRQVCREILSELLPARVRIFRDENRIEWGIFYQAVRATIDELIADPPAEVLAEFAASRELSAEEQAAWRYSERAHRIKDEACRRAFGRSMRGLPDRVKRLLAALPPKDLDEAVAAIGDVKGLEGHLGPDGANSYFGSACGVIVNEAVMRVLHLFAERRDDLGRQARTAVKLLQRDIARRSKDRTAPVLRPDVDSMQDAVLEAAAGRGPRRTIRPALLKPHMNRGGDWVERKTSDGKDILVAMPVTDAKGRFPQRPESDFETNPEIAADFLDGQSEDADARPVARAFGCPADRAMASERDAEIHAVEEHFRGLNDMAALACLDYLLEREGRQTRDDAAAFYGVSASQVRSAERRVLSELEPRLRRFVERSRDGTAAG